MKAKNLLSTLFILGSGAIALAGEKVTMENDALAKLLAAPALPSPVDPKTFTVETWKQLSYLKVGTTRADLEQHCHMDGGINDMIEVRYNIAHQEGQGDLQTTVLFRPSEMDEATYRNPDLRQRWLHNHPTLADSLHDVVMSFGKLYWGHAVWD